LNNISDSLKNILILYLLSL